MANRDSNPFQTIDISVPIEFHDAFERYCHSQGKTDIDESPFPRMIDLWFTAVCVAAYLDLEPVDIGKRKTTKIISGTIFSSDPWRVHTLMLLAIGNSGDEEIVLKPSRMMAIASGLAIAGLPKVIEMLKDGDGDAIWNLSDELYEILSDSKVA